LRENWEISMSSERDGRSDRPVKAGSRTTGMHGVEKSDGPVVPTKPPNETRRDSRRVEEVVEGRGPTLGNTDEKNTSRTQRRVVVSSALDRVREAAKKDRETKFTAGKVNWVPDADIRGVFDTIDHEWLMLIEHTVVAPRMHRQMRPRPATASPVSGRALRRHDPM
jgi:hypothetical protein